MVAGHRQGDAEPRAAPSSTPTSMRPSCASTIFRTIASPSPEPCGLVVKNGLKILSTTSAGIPGPLSVTSTCTIGPCGSPPAGPSSFSGERDDADRAVAAERLERVRQQVREDLPQLVRIALDRRQMLRAIHADLHVAARHVALGHRHRVADRVGDRDPFHLQPDRPDEIEHLEHDGVGHLGFLDDVAEDRLRIRRVGQLPLEDPRHHLDAGERILHFVRDRRRHLAERRQPVAQPFPLLELLDAGQILEEQRRAGDLPSLSRTCDSV